MRKLEQIKQQREPGKTETKIQTWTPKTVRRDQIIRIKSIFIKMVMANVY